MKSNEFTEGYLPTEDKENHLNHATNRSMHSQRTHASDEVIQASVGQIPQDIEEDQVLDQLAPHCQNSKGAIVVEVEKVVRDLIMLTKTIKSAKFFRVIMGTTTIENIEEAWMDETDQQKVVQNYRQILNNFFKMIHKLN